VGTLRDSEAAPADLTRRISSLKNKLQRSATIRAANAMSCPSPAVLRRRAEAEAELGAAHRQASEDANGRASEAKAEFAQMQVRPSDPSHN
jgi:hypothetical protein